jgi:hypothetical protein
MLGNKSWGMNAGEQNLANETAEFLAIPVRSARGAFLGPDAQFNLRPKLVRGLFDRKKLPRRLGDCLQIAQQRTA